MSKDPATPNSCHLLWETEREKQCKQTDHCGARKRYAAVSRWHCLFFSSLEIKSNVKLKKLNVLVWLLWWSLTMVELQANAMKHGDDLKTQIHLLMKFELVTDRSNYWQRPTMHVLQIIWRLYFWQHPVESSMTYNQSSLTSGMQWWTKRPATRPQYVLHTHFKQIDLY